MSERKRGSEDDRDSRQHALAESQGGLPEDVDPVRDRALARELAGSTGLEPAASGVTGRQRVSEPVPYQVLARTVSRYRSADRGQSRARSNGLAHALQELEEPIQLGCIACSG